MQTCSWHLVKLTFKAKIAPQSQQPNTTKQWEHNQLQLESWFSSVNNRWFLLLVLTLLLMKAKFAMIVVQGSRHRHSWASS
jgi:hypothetical protein